MTNVLAETDVIYDDTRRRIVRVNVTDLEANISYPKTVTIEKTVERKNRKGRIVLGERLNSYDEIVYIVEATEDEILNKENALISKAMRTCALRVIPGDLIDEAIYRIYETRKKEAFNDPDSYRKKLIDSFASLNVMPKDLKGPARARCRHGEPGGDVASSPAPSSRSETVRPLGRPLWSAHRMTTARARRPPRRNPRPSPPIKPRPRRMIWTPRSSRSTKPSVRRPRRSN